MADTEQLLVLLEAKISDFERNLKRAARTMDASGQQIEERGRRMGRNLERELTSSTARVNAALSRMGDNVGTSLSAVGARAGAALGAVLSVNELKRYADTWTETANKIAAAGEAAENVGARQSELVDLAMRSRSDFGSVVDLYTGLRRATEELGASQAQVLKVTETISKGFVVGGVSAQTAAGSIIQLNQAFQSGKLSGDELNSVLEGAPPIARLIAREFGVSVGRLKELAEEGKLTSAKVFEAILKGASSIEEEFAKTSSTISQAFTNLSTSFTRYVGQTDQAVGASKAVAGAIQGLANNMDIAAPAAAALGAALLGAWVGGPIGAGIAGATVALVGFGDVVRPISSDLATLGDYARAAFAYMQDGASAVAPHISAAFQQAAELATIALNAIGTSDALPTLLSATKATVNAIIGTFVAAVETIRTTWNTLGFSMAETIINAMNATIAAVQAAVNKVVGAVNSITSGINSAGSKVGVDVGLGQIGTVDLGQISNRYAGAGKAAAEGYGKAFEALSKDYVGAAIDAGTAGLDALRTKANQIAAQRIMNSPTRGGLDNGSLDQKLKNPAGDKDKDGGAEKQDAFEKEVAAIEKRTRAFDSERQAVGRSAQEAAKAEAEFRLLEAAKKANVPVTDELRAKVDALATAYATAKVKLQEAEQQQRRVQETQRYLGDAMSDAVSDLLVEGRSLSDVFDNLAKSLAKAAIQAVLLGNGPLGSLMGGSGLLGGSSSSGGSGGGLLGGLFSFMTGGFNPIPGFDGGGYTGDGGKLEPAGVVHKGEYVLPADVVKRIGVQRLEGLRKGYSNGGLVGAPSIPAAPGGRLGGSGISISAPVTVNASGGTPEANADLARQMSRQVENSMRRVVVDELMRQMRPRGVLNM